MFIPQYVDVIVSNYNYIYFYFGAKHCIYQIIWITIEEKV